MVFYCSAYNCKNSTKDKSLSFHAYAYSIILTSLCTLRNPSNIYVQLHFRFPLHNPKLLKTWLKNLRWKDWTPASHSKLCSVHFENKCFVSEGKRIRLTPGAVPTIFTFSNRKVWTPVKIKIIWMSCRLGTYFLVFLLQAKIDPRSRRALVSYTTLRVFHLHIKIF